MIGYCSKAEAPVNVIALDKMLKFTSLHLQPRGLAWTHYDPTEVQTP